MEEYEWVRTTSDTFGKEISIFIMRNFNPQEGTRSTMVSIEKGTSVLVEDLKKATIPHSFLFLENN